MKNSRQWKKALLALGMLAAMPFTAGVAHADDLAQIFNLAVDRDPVVREARARYNATHTQVAQGRALLLPSLSVSGQTARQTRGPIRVAPDDPFDSQPHDIADGFNSKGYSINLSQTLINFEAWYAYESILSSDQAAAVTLAQQEQELIMRVATAYFDVLRSRENLEAFESEVNAAERQLEQARERFEVGLVPITDVNDAQANYDLALVNELVEQNNYEQRLEVLEAITGVNHESLETLSEDFPLTMPQPSSMEDWVLVAEENNLAVQAATYNLDASEADARAARAAMYPTVDISASYGYSKDSSGAYALFPGGIANLRTSAQLSVSIPLFAGGGNLARKRQAYYARDAQEEVLLRTERESVLNARNSFRNVVTSMRAVEARRQAIISAQSALEATEAGAEVGTRNVVDVVLAQRLLFQALREFANARYDYVIATLQLKQAAGTLNPQDIYDLNEWLVP